MKLTLVKYLYIVNYLFRLVYLVKIDNILITKDGGFKVALTGIR